MMRNMRASVVQVLCLWVVISACGCTAFIQVQTEISPELHDLSLTNQTEEHSQHKEQVQSTNKHGRRKLLIQSDETSKILNDTITKATVESNSGNWNILVGVLLSVFSVAFLIVLAVKFRVFQRYLSGYRDALLPEEDAASQFSHIGTISETFPQMNLNNREAYAGDHDDDDGFIEDNYIEASKKYMDEGQEEEDSDDELSIQFSIE